MLSGVSTDGSAAGLKDEKKEVCTTTTSSREEGC